MSILFDATADRLLRTTDLPDWAAGGQWTETGWFRFAAATGGLQTAFTILRDDVSAYIFVGLLSDNTFYFENSSGASFSGPTLTANTWYHLAYSYEVGVGSNFYINGSSVGGSGGDALAGTPERMERGGWRSTGGNRWNGDQAAHKTWLRILTEAEIAAEMDFAAPVDATDIYGAWYMQNAADVADYSGNARDWTAFGTLDSSSNPPGVTFPSTGLAVPVAYHQRLVQGMS